MAAKGNTKKAIKRSNGSASGKKARPQTRPMYHRDVAIDVINENLVKLTNGQMQALVEALREMTGEIKRPHPQPLEHEHYLALLGEWSTLPAEVSTGLMALLRGWPTLTPLVQSAIRSTIAAPQRT